MLVEIILIQPLWDFNITVVFLQVIWAIGLCMLFLAVLQYLPYGLLLGLGLIIIFAHNVLDGIVIETPFWKSVIWAVVHQQNDYLISERLLLVIQYPFLPWLGIMILGYAAGRLYVNELSSELRRNILRMAGGVFILLFVVIRSVNMYGDLHQWTIQKTTIFTILDFINVWKYPPSLLYILMTIGPSLILLSYLEYVSGFIAAKLIIFGKVPFFYYVLHVFLIHSIAILIFVATGHSWSDLDFDHFRDGSLPYGSGQPLWVVYAVWALVIVALYFPCRWYSRYKATHKTWWLSYV
jgi:uncharacterized membrane protein